MKKKEDKLVDKIAKLKTEVQALEAQLPQSGVKAKMREEIEGKITEDAKKREAEAAQKAVMAKFDNGIYSNEQAAAEAKAEAKKALIAGDKRVADEYTRLYAISKKLAGDLKVQKAQYRAGQGVRMRIALAVAIQSAATADMKSMSDDPVDFLVKNEELSKQMAEQQRMWDAVMDRLGEDTDKMSATVDSKLFDDAQAEIAAEAEIERAGQLAAGAKIPSGVQTTFSGKAMLDALKNENDEG